MRRFKTLLLLVVLLGVTPCAFAQFSISKVTPEQVAIKVTEDSSKKKIVNLDNNFYSRARYKAERRAIRQERNTLQINASAMFNQTGFTNWYAGGDNVFSTSLAFYFSHKYVKNKFNLQTTFDARYGINRINKENFKNEDAFVFNLSSSWEINKNWSYAATFQYRSQFSKGYKSRTDNTLVSNFMAPGTIAPAIGFIYRNKKVPLTINIMPVSGSVTFVLDTVLSNQGAYGVNPGEKALALSVPRCKSISKRASAKTRSLIEPIFTPSQTTTPIVTHTSTGKIPSVSKYTNSSQPKPSALLFTMSRPYTGTTAMAAVELQIGYWISLHIQKQIALL